MEAGNAEGKVNFTFNLNVQCKTQISLKSLLLHLQLAIFIKRIFFVVDPAGIKKLSEVVIVDAFTSPMLTCEVDANPMTDKMVCCCSMLILLTLNTIFEGRLVST